MDKTLIAALARKSKIKMTDKETESFSHDMQDIMRLIDTITEFDLCDRDAVGNASLSGFLHNDVPYGDNML